LSASASERGRNRRERISYIYERIILFNYSPAVDIKFIDIKCHVICILLSDRFELLPAFKSGPHFQVAMLRRQVGAHVPASSQRNACCHIDIADSRISSWSASIYTNGYGTCTTVSP
jgi:hypothetical protein